MTCTGCGCKLTKQTKFKDRLLCHPCYKKWHKNYCNKQYPKGSLKWRTYCFNRNRAGAHLKEYDLEAILLRQTRKCKTCLINLADVKWEIDHIVPVSVGGSHNPSNLQILCKRCNRAKDNGSMMEFRAWIKQVIEAMATDPESVVTVS